MAPKAPQTHVARRKLRVAEVASTNHPSRVTFPSLASRAPRAWAAFRGGAWEQAAQGCASRPTSPRARPLGSSRRFWRAMGRSFSTHSPCVCPVILVEEGVASRRTSFLTASQFLRDEHKSAAERNSHGLVERLTKRAEHSFLASPRCELSVCAASAREDCASWRDSGGLLQGLNLED
jgi:hypothetical protein